jgi:hypothetical protein
MEVDICKKAPKNYAKMGIFYQKVNKFAQWVFTFTQQKLAIKKIWLSAPPLFASFTCTISKNMQQI